MDILRLFFDCDEFCREFEPYLSAKQLSDGKRHRQRASTLSISEVMTIVILFQLSGFRNFKTYYTQHVCAHLRSEFPHLVSYQRFVQFGDRKSTRLNSSHRSLSRMPSSA